MTGVCQRQQKSIDYLVLNMYYKLRFRLDYLFVMSLCENARKNERSVLEVLNPRLQQELYVSIQLVKIWKLLRRSAYQGVRRIAWRAKRPLLSEKAIYYYDVVFVYLFVLRMNRLLLDVGYLRKDIGKRTSFKCYLVVT